MASYAENVSIWWRHDVVEFEDCRWDAYLMRLFQTLFYGLIWKRILVYLGKTRMVYVAYLQ